MSAEAKLMDTHDDESGGRRKWSNFKNLFQCNNKGFIKSRLVYQIIVVCLISSFSQCVIGTKLNSTLAEDLLVSGGSQGNLSFGATNEGTKVGQTARNSTPVVITSFDGSSLSLLNKDENVYNSSNHDAQSDTNKLKLTIQVDVPKTNTTSFFEKQVLNLENLIIGKINSNDSLLSKISSLVAPTLTLVKQTTEPGDKRRLLEKPTIIGLRVEEAEKPVTYEDGASRILSSHDMTIRFFGSGFTTNTLIRFVAEEGERGTNCNDFTSTKYFHFDADQIFTNSAVAKVQIPPLKEGKYYVCIKEDQTNGSWIHQGSEQWIVLTTYKKLLPLWVHICLLALLLTLSGLFSGLNLGLMAIDRTELKILMNAGSDKEKRYAKKIHPLRTNGNYLLCTLLLGNVLVNATLTILLDDLTTGLIAVVGSTLGIVIFGEIVPQAVCSRHGLAVGAHTVWITKFFMLLTSPLSYPISMILNKVLGEELGNVYNRDRLKELIRVTEGKNDLGKDEMNIISGALDLKQKTVVDVMTKLEDVYMLHIDSALDFATISEIMATGYSRIPVYEGSRGNVISVLYTKDLAFIDPDDNMPLRSICEFYNNPCHFVFENVTLNVLFNVFKQGSRGHMAFVQRIQIHEKLDLDPIYEVIGLVTMEDVIEEIIQEEISDETDVQGVAEKRHSLKDKPGRMSDFALSLVKTEGTTVSSQLTLAAFQFLSTAVEEFSEIRISKSVLEKMLDQNIYFHIRVKDKDSAKHDPGTILYERGKPADYFIMILEGKAVAEIGTENLTFESGPFSYFGSKGLMHISGAFMPSPELNGKISNACLSDISVQPMYVPDYTVRAISDLTYLRISYCAYASAKQATMLEKSFAACDDNMDYNMKNQFNELSEDSDEKSSDKGLTLGKPRGSLEESRTC